MAKKNFQVEHEKDSPSINASLATEWKWKADVKVRHAAFQQPGEGKLPVSAEAGVRDQHDLDLHAGAPLLVDEGHDRPEELDHVARVEGVHLLHEFLPDVGHVAREGGVHDEI